MNRRTFLKIAGIGVGAQMLGTGSNATAATGELPNMVLFLADDMGYGDPQCLNPESKIPTPNMNRLAEEGMVFTDAHSPSAVCSPTRYSILTGQYAWRSRLKRGVLWQYDLPLIPEDRLTLPAMLKKHGYATACIGKWHLGWEWPTTDGSTIEDYAEFAQMNDKARTAFGEKIDFTKPIKNGPTTRGFDYYFGTSVPNFPPYCFLENDHTVGIPSAQKPDDIYGHPGPMLPGWEQEKILPTLTEKAVDYIERHAKSSNDKPFFMFLTSTAPHTPIRPDKPFQGKSQAGPYGDLVHQVDWTIGSIMEALDRNGIAENTIFIVSSDNGSPARAGDPFKHGRDFHPPGTVVEKFGHNPSYIYRGMKWKIWDGGHRVPFFIRWPARIKAGSKCGQTVCLTDIMATMAGLTGDKLPRDAGEDSYDISPLWFGEDRQIREATVHHDSGGRFAIRQGKWKFIEGKGKSVKKNAELYDMQADPSEKNNLYDERQDIVNKLSKLLQEYRDTGRSKP